MAKKYKDKMMETDTESKQAELLVLRDCEMPFIGQFKSGQVISDQETIRKIGDNPNFERRGGVTNG
jgi:hypothetical protein